MIEPEHQIDPMRVYSASDVIELGKIRKFPIRSRTTLQKLIESGKLAPMNSGTEEKPIYYFMGATLYAFMDSHEKPLYIHQRPRKVLQMVRKTSIGPTPSLSEKHVPKTKKRT